MYCPECGTRIDDDAVFCPECGTRVADDAAHDAALEDAPEAAPEAAAMPSVEALLLTHLPALADKMGTTVAAVRAALEAFIAGRRAQGIGYTLVDGGEVLTRDSSWVQWVDFVSRYYQTGLAGQAPRATHLFIVGGDDIVPMPEFSHYLDDTTDRTIDTDLPFGYPFGGKDVERALETGAIFNYDSQYVVGRLPIPEDARLSYLTNYLERAVALPYVKVRHAYSQCDPHWRLVTCHNVKELAENGMLKVAAPAVPSDICYQGIYLTPEVESQTVARYLTPETQLAFFNLHGSAAPGVTGFMGQSVNDASDWRKALLPEDMQLLVRPNIIVTEACYGARFKGFTTQESMLQSAFAAQGLLYLGSSRIAYGAVDSKFKDKAEIEGSLADVLTQEFVSSLLQGYTAGDALCKARFHLLDNYETGPYEATTLTEFNLYGDPTLQVAIAAAGKAATVAKPKRYNPQKATNNLEAKTMDVVPQRSILNMVRDAVDSQLQQIHETVAKQLYEYWGIQPRKFLGATRLQYARGTKAIALHYEADEETATAKARQLGLTSRISVVTEEGKIRAVYAAK